MTEETQDINMWPGAIAACVVPMVLGLIATLGLLLFSRGPEMIFLLPISLCVLFGTPIAAWLACRSLKGEDVIEWGSSVLSAIGAATTVQFSAALFHFFVVVIFDVIWGHTPDSVYFYFFIGSIFLNVALWIFITLPFAVFCATIFWCVTKFRGDTDRL